MFRPRAADALVVLMTIGLVVIASVVVAIARTGDVSPLAILSLASTSAALAVGLATIWNGRREADRLEIELEVDREIFVAEASARDALAVLSRFLETHPPAGADEWWSTDRSGTEEGQGAIATQAPEPVPTLLGNIDKASQSLAQVGHLEIAAELQNELRRLLISHDRPEWLLRRLGNDR